MKKNKKSSKRLNDLSVIIKLGSSKGRDLLADLLFQNSRINSSAECIDFSITTNLE